MPDKKSDIELGINYFPVMFGISVERKLGSLKLELEFSSREFFTWSLNQNIRV